MLWFILTFNIKERSHLQYTRCMKNIFYPFAISAGIILITFGIFHTMEKYFSDTLHLLKEHPFQFGIISFLILASDIILPIPSSIVLYINGFFLGAIGGTFVSMAGLMAGAVIGYIIGKSSSNVLKSERHHKANRVLSRYGPAAIFLTRGIPILSESLCFVCGYNRIDFKRYLMLNFVGYLPVCSLHAIFGYMGYAGGSIFLMSFTVSVAISIVFWFFGKKILPGHELT